MYKRLVQSTILLGIILGITQTAMALPIHSLASFSKQSAVQNYDAGSNDDGRDSDHELSKQGAGIKSNKHSHLFHKQGKHGHKKKGSHNHFRPSPSDPVPGITVPEEDDESAPPPTISEGDGYSSIDLPPDDEGSNLSFAITENGTPYSDSFSDSLTTVPEPATFTLLGSGLAGLGLWRRRKMNPKQKI